MTSAGGIVRFNDPARQIDRLTSYPGDAKTNRDPAGVAVIHLTSFRPGYTGSYWRSLRLIYALYFYG